MPRRTPLLVLLVVGAQLARASLDEALEEHLKDVEHNQAEESLKHDKHKGEKLHEVDSTLTDTHKNQYSKSSDEGKYVKKDHDLKSASEADSYKGYDAKRDKAEDSETAGFKRGHKKGHHKQGFQNSYHKDESSNKSTFFDDFNDEGDQAAYNSRLNSHNNQGSRAYQGAHNNGQEYVRDNYRGGAYDRYGDLGNKHKALRDHERKYYSNDDHNYNKYHNERNDRDWGNVRDYRRYHAPAPRDPAWDWQRWDERRRWDRPEWQGDRGWERDYDAPGYYDGHGVRHRLGYGLGYGYGESRTAPVAQVPRDAPLVAHRKQTITIYEDPRYDVNHNGQLRKEEGDYLQLEFKPSNHRYAQYDDTYYAPGRGHAAAAAGAGSTTGGAVQASEINRLVYNYRRQ